MKTKSLSSDETAQLPKVLEVRFTQNLNRHSGLRWKEVQARLKAQTGKLWSLQEMEKTGGEPDVVGFDKKTGEFLFVDCSAESPKGRASLCYDRAGLAMFLSTTMATSRITRAGDFAVL